MISPLMATLALVTSPLAASPEPSTAIGVQPSDAPKGEPSIAVKVVAVGAEHTIAAFMDDCVRTRWDPDKVRSAVKTSGLAFVEERTNLPHSFAWTSRHARLHLEITPDFSQCALSTGSIQPRTGEQILAMLKPAVEAELGHTVQENSDRFYLEWTDASSGFVERITLSDATSKPQQALWYLYDRSAPGVRERFDALYPPSKQASPGDRP